MSEGKLIKKVYIKCSNTDCNLIVPYKQTFRNKLLYKTKIYKTCGCCNTNLDKNGQKYNM